MIVSATTARALNDIAQRESELGAAFTPGAQPMHSEIAAAESLERDASPLSVAAQGNAYFVLRDPNGGELFTRDGVFRIEKDTLVDRNGMPVLGLQHGGVLAPLKVDAIDGALGRIANLQITSDGSLLYQKAAIDPATRQVSRLNVVVGRLALARFSAATQLQFVDNAHFRAPATIPPHFGMPSDGNFLPLTTNAHQRSRIDLLTGIDKLQDSYIAFDAFRAAHSAQGRTEKIAMDLVK